MMPYELHPTAFLAPYVCAVCRCHKDEPHALVSNLTDENGMAVFICRACAQEMADLFGITKAEPLPPVEVPREPTEAEILQVIERRFRLSPAPAGEPTTANTWAQSAAAGAEICACGKTYTGPAAKANMARHKATCPKAKEADGGGDQ